jgi:cytochrome c oxidase assembly protein subunit 15
MRPWAWTALALVFAQILLGGFVAGTDAGMTYNTWPLMDGRFIPEGLWTVDPWWLNPFENIVMIQFNHRIGAYAVMAAAAAVWWRARATGGGVVLRLAEILAAAVVAQVALGIATLIAVMPLWLAALHQFGALAVLTASVALAYAVHAGQSTQRGT